MKSEAALHLHALVTSGAGIPVIFGAQPGAQEGLRPDLSYDQETEAQQKEAFTSTSSA